MTGAVNVVARRRRAPGWSGDTYGGVRPELAALTGSSSTSRRRARRRARRCRRPRPAPRPSRDGPTSVGCSSGERAGRQADLAVLVGRERVGDRQVAGRLEQHRLERLARGVRRRPGARHRRHRGGRRRACTRSAAAATVSSVSPLNSQTTPVTCTWSPIATEPAGRGREDEDRVRRLPCVVGRRSRRLDDVAVQAARRVAAVTTPSVMTVAPASGDVAPVPWISAIVAAVGVTGPVLPTTPGVGVAAVKSAALSAVLASVAFRVDRLGVRRRRAPGRCPRKPSRPRRSRRGRRRTGPRRSRRRRSSGPSRRDERDLARRPAHGDRAGRAAGHRRGPAAHLAPPRRRRRRRGRSCRSAASSARPRPPTTRTARTSRRR